jgi:hypothetical protein
MKARTARIGALLAVVAAASLVAAGTAGAGVRSGPKAGCVGAGKQATAAVGSVGRAGWRAVRTLASAGRSPSVQLVSGYSVLDQMTGGLQGTWTWTAEGDNAFFSSLRYDQATGVMTYRVPEVFVGTIAGRTGTLLIDGFVVQRFEPGTPLYDFSSFPSEQPGTTGDAAQWLSGWCVHRIMQGTGGLAGASGIIYFRDITYLYDANYWGIVRL